MPIQTPHTYKELHSALYEAKAAIENIGKGQKPSEQVNGARYVLLEALSDATNFFEENAPIDIAVKSRNMLAEQPHDSFNCLDPYLAEGENGEGVREGVLHLSNTAMDIRGAFDAGSDLTDILLADMVDSVKSSMGSHWNDSRNHADALIDAFYDVVKGKHIPFSAIFQGIENVNSFVRNISGYGGPTTGLSDAEVAKQMGRLTKFGHNIVALAEEYAMPKPRPVESVPVTARIFADAPAA